MLSPEGTGWLEDRERGRCTVESPAPCILNVFPKCPWLLMSTKFSAAHSLSLYPLLPPGSPLEATPAPSVPGPDSGSCFPTCFPPTGSCSLPPLPSSLQPSPAPHIPAPPLPLSPGPSPQTAGRGPPPQPPPVSPPPVHTASAGSDVQI